MAQRAIAVCYRACYRRSGLPKGQRLHHRSGIARVGRAISQLVSCHSMVSIEQTWKAAHTDTCCRIWYRSAQSVKTIDPPETMDARDAVVEDYLDEAIDITTGEHKTTNTAHDPPNPVEAPVAYDAFNELRIHELTALALCFLGPLIGSYILHVIRSQLSTIGDQLVSNLHLTLFVLGAEIRPLRHAMKMAERRTLYLQRIVKEDPYVSAKDKDQDARLNELRGRIDEVEASYSDKLMEQSNVSKGKQPDNTEDLKRLQSSMQTQIDALTRAVRRYEKRQTTQSMQTESRLQELDVRLKDSISLAAAAANYAQRPGVVAAALNQAAMLFSLPLKAAHTAFVMPFQFASTFLISLALRTGLVHGRPARTAPKAPSRPKTQSRMVSKVK